MVAVLGPNGAGKSTLLEAIGGVLPAAGTIRRDGRVATVLQSPGLARRSARANVELALAWWGVPRGERRGRGRWRRSTRAARRPPGQPVRRRRCRAASGAGSTWPAGSPYGPTCCCSTSRSPGLDPETHAALVEDAASALRIGAAAPVLVVHDRADAWALADRLVVLLDGRIAADGPPARLLADPPTAEVARFLGYDGSLRSGDTVTLTRCRTC